MTLSNVSWVLALHSSDNHRDDYGKTVVLNQQDVALLDAAFNAARRKSLVCRASTLQTTIGRLCRNLRTSLQHTPFYGLRITTNDNNNNGQSALTTSSPAEVEDDGILAAWEMLDKLYDDALETGKPLVVHVASYSASDIAELVKMHVSSPLVWRWIAKNIFWEEVQQGRVVRKHSDVFAPFD